MKIQTDFLVIGSGIAGLAYALSVAEQGKVVVVSKKEVTLTTTSYAQGGLAAVLNAYDSFEKHIQDTLIAGDGLCDEEIVKIVVKEGPIYINKLIEMGTHFDLDKKGDLDLAKEGGHSEKRIVHHKDNTGNEIQRALTQKVIDHPNIQVLDNHFAIDLITQHHLGYTVKRTTPGIECYGAYILDRTTKKIFTIVSKITFLATGGIGNIYETTTNPEISTGDGIAMAYRAKAQCENMEFVQFHPTSLFNPKERPSFLITEAIRGFGAKLKTKDGKEFMHKYDDRKELAPRDIVTRAIDKELKNRGENFVYLDATHLNPKALKDRFPNIYNKCLSIGIDITKDFIPVVPAAHYMCGGVKINKNGETSIKNLYAGGETACSGLHGANRLASNSLTESVVLSNRAARRSLEILSEIKCKNNLPDWNDTGTVYHEEMVLITQSIREMRQIMTNYVGVVRSDLRLKRALDRLEIIYKETEELYEKSPVSVELCELRNAINVGYLIIKMAQNRKESRGLHYSLNYPDKQKL